MKDTSTILTAVDAESAEKAENAENAENAEIKIYNRTPGIIVGFDKLSQRTLLPELVEGCGTRYLKIKRASTGLTLFMTLAQASPSL